MQRYGASHLECVAPEATQRSHSNPGRPAAILPALRWSFLAEHLPPDITYLQDCNMGLGDV